MVYPSNEIIFSHKKEQNIDACFKMNELQKHVEQNKPARQSHRLYDSMYTKHPEQADPLRQ